MEKLKLSIVILVILLISSTIIFYSFNDGKKININYSHRENIFNLMRRNNSESEESCMSLSEDFVLSDEYYELLDKLTNYSGIYSIIYKELDDDLTVIEYEESYEFYGESIIKLAYAIYIYDYLKDNQEELNTKLEYDSSFYKTGSGVLRYMNLTNESFTINELLYYVIEDSDNIAYFMLLDYFGIEGVKEYWNNLGTNLTYEGWDYFGILDARDAIVYLDRLYEIIESNDVYYDNLISSSKDASKNSILQETLNEDMYFKYGGANYCYHEIAIVDDDHPYMIVVLSDLSTTDRFALFPEVAQVVQELHEMYWEEKNEYCMA
ncbi:MAG: serine hydrolase [bacterium]